MQNFTAVFQAPGYAPYEHPIKALCLVHAHSVAQKILMDNWDEIPTLRLVVIEQES